MEEFKKELYALLNEGKRNTIVFEKNDGTIRTLIGTRNLEAIPEEFHPKNIYDITNGPTIPVFDLEKNQWRAFTVKKLHSINDVDYKTVVEKLA